MGNPSNWLAVGYDTIAVNGTILVAQRTVLNFPEGCTATDNPDTGQTDLTIPGASSGIEALTGDVVATGTGTVTATVVAVHGSTVPAGGALTPGNLLYVSGTSALSYGPLILEGGSGWVTGVLPVANGGTGLSSPGADADILVSTGSAWASVALSGGVSITDAGVATVNLGNGHVNGTLPLSNYDHTGSSYNVLQMNSSGSAVVWGPVQLSNSGAVTGALQVGNGGTGLTSVGSIGQVLATDGSVMEWINPPTTGITRLTNDVLAGPGTGVVTATVVALQGNAINATAPTAGQILIEASGATQSIWTSLAGDGALSYTGALTVVGAQNGTFIFNGGGGIYTVPGVTGAGLFQEAPTTDVAPHAMTVSAQSAYASAATNTQGATLTLSPGAGTSGSALSGNVVFAMPTYNTAIGTSSALQMTAGGTINFQVWGYDNATTGLWIGPANTYTSLNSANLYTDGTHLYVNASSGVTIEQGGVDLLACTSSLIRFTPSSSNVAQMNGVTGETSLGFNLAVGAYAGGSYGGAVGGAIYVNNIGTAPTTSISGGALLFAESGALAIYPSGATGAQFFVSATQTGINGSLIVGGLSPSPLGGSQGTIGLTNATSLPGAISSGVCLAANAGVFAVYDEFGHSIQQSGSGLTWDAGSTPVLTIAASNNNGATGNQLTFQGQNMTGTTSTGGNVLFNPGTGTTTNGSVVIQNGGANKFVVGPTQTNMAGPVAGLGTNPFQWAQSSVTVTAASSTTLTSAQLITPVLVCSTVTLTGNSTINFGNVAYGFFLLDVSGVTPSAHSLLLVNGSATVTLSAFPTGNLVMVMIRGTNNITAN